MKLVHDASKGCNFQDRHIFFDTNIWIAIDGNNPSASKAWVANYSDFLASTLKSATNTIITNDYVLSEFFNRIVKISYDIRYRDEADKAKYYKSRRKDGTLADILAQAKDEVLNIIEYYAELDLAVTHDTALKDIVTETSKGELDFGDIIIREHCHRKGYILVTDDADFCDCGLEIVTSNPKILHEANKRGVLA